MVCWSVMYVEMYRIVRHWYAQLMYAIIDGFPTVLVVMSGVITLTKAGDLWLSPIKKRSDCNGVVSGYWTFA